MSSEKIEGTLDDVEILMNPKTIRARAEAMFRLAQSGGTQFEVDLDALPEVVERVRVTTLAAYPTLEIPHHSRWGHFQVGGKDRVAELGKRLEDLNSADRARAKLDLVIVSVLLDAGAGAAWKFREFESGGTYNRSEGLAVASFRMFISGLFSSDPKRKFQVDADGLERLTREELEAGFQLGAGNPMDGFEGRFQLLKNLASALRKNSKLFGSEPARPGNLFRYFEKTIGGQRGFVAAPQLLRRVQEGLGPIWPGRLEMAGVNLGDTWRYPALGSGLDGLVPFHKLSQWLTYSLFEPLEEAGIPLRDSHLLTGLAEYRNGGLFVDGGVLRLRDPELLKVAHAPSSPLIIEWRALTLHLIEKLAAELRVKLNKTESQFPLGKVLEGGTWRTGREYAIARRPDASPPIKIQSDGTVF